MDVSARLRYFPVLALVAFGLLVSAPHARADDAFVLNRHVPTLRSLAAPAQVQTAAPAATAAVEPICLFANGYDATGATPCAGCFDVTLNFAETDVDCGGIYCKACADGQHCAVNGDCSSTVCNTPRPPYAHPPPARTAQRTGARPTSIAAAVVPRANLVKDAFLPVTV